MFDFSKVERFHFEDVKSHDEHASLEVFVISSSKGNVGQEEISSDETEESGSPTAASHELGIHSKRQ